MVLQEGEFIKEVFWRIGDPYTIIKTNQREVLETECENLEKFKDEIKDEFN